MKNLLTIVLILIVSFSAKSQIKIEAYPESGFNAAFPLKPVIQKNILDSEIGKLPAVFYQCQGEDYLLMVAENIYPKDLVEKLGSSGMKGVFDGAKNGMIKNLEKQLGATFEKTSDEEFLFNGKHSANKVSGSISGIDISAICIMNNNHFYIVMAIGNTKSEAVAAFIKSFTFIEA